MWILEYANFQWGISWWKKEEKWNEFTPVAPEGGKCKQDVFREKGMRRINQRKKQKKDLRKIRVISSVGEDRCSEPHIRVLLGWRTARPGLEPVSTIHRGNIARSGRSDQLFEVRPRPRPWENPQAGVHKDMLCGFKNSTFFKNQN